jgi:hypothetical protein
VFERFWLRLRRATDWIAIRRECLDHIVVLNESGLRRILKLYIEYYERSRTPL